MEKYQLSSQHYLAIAQRLGHRYYTDFVEAFNTTSSKLSERQLKALKQKLQIVESKRFVEDSFIQIACETSVCTYFAKHFPNGFKYEQNCNPSNNTDVDCQFTDGQYIYNVEVKCPGLETYKEKVHEMPKIELKGRFDEEGRNLVKFINSALKDYMDKEQVGWNYDIKKRLDNTLKTFLQESDNKFPAIESASQVNILVVCCDDADDMTRWHDYLYQAEGLFTKTSFINPETYGKTDIVMFTNLLNRHYAFNEKSICGNSWDLNDAFNLCFGNPFKDPDNKSGAILNFVYKFPHYTEQLVIFVEEQCRLKPSQADLITAFPIRYFLPELESALSREHSRDVSFFAKWK